MERPGNVKDFYQPDAQQPGSDRKEADQRGDSNQANLLAVVWPGHAPVAVDGPDQDKEEGQANKTILKLPGENIGSRVAVIVQAVKGITRQEQAEQRTQSGIDRAALYDRVLAREEQRQAHRRPT